MKRFASLLLSLVLVSALLGTISPSAFAGSSPQPTQQTEGTVGVYRGTLEVVKYDVSPPLRSIPPMPVPTGSFRDEYERDQMALPNGPQDIDPVAQTTVGAGEIPAPIISFDGPSNRSSVSPPDPNGDVGPNHYVAMSNLSFQIYSKTGTSLYGPAYNNTLWAGFGGPCQTENQGDPIVLHDQISDRWMLSQFTANGPTYYNCVAVSTTADPTGSYYRWAVSTGTNFPDYPKYGFWADGLYISTRDFAGGSSYTQVGAYAIDRAGLIAGNPSPTIISFAVSHTTLPYNTGDGLLPADLDGDTLPPAGSPEYFIGSMDQGGPYGAPQDALTVYEFHADFATPANSTFTLAATLPMAAFDSMLSTCSGRACIPQLGTTYKVDHLGYRQRPLHRAAYRNFGTHESIVTNQSVEGSAAMSGVRWWEIRDLSTTPVVYQEGTYNPGATDGIFRWMGSIAMDHEGNMGLSYSASSSTMHPAIWYTGRLASDPLGTMPQGEASIYDGPGSQTGGGNRWGDYSSVTVDPVDDCTFWIANEYLVTTASSNWRLRIGAFKFPSCGITLSYTNYLPAVFLNSPTARLLGLSTQP